VAVTDEGLIPGIIGTGEIVGRRVSSAAFGFRQPVVLAGGALGAGTLQGTFTLDYDDPLNPSNTSSIRITTIWTNDLSRSCRKARKPSP
jgi:hypothetical protein